jgi:transposase
MNSLSARDSDTATEIDNDATAAGDRENDPATSAVSRTGDLPGPLPGRRRRFTSEEKRLFITQAMSPGESMSSVGRRHGLSVSLLFRWRRQLDSDLDQKTNAEPSAPRSDTRDLREKVRELERLLGRKTLEVELLQQELSRLGHNPVVALQALDNVNAGATASARR